MRLEITYEHLAKSRRVEYPGGNSAHHTFLNPIAVALHDIDEHAVVTLEKVHRTCAHGTACAHFACAPTPLPPEARAWLQSYVRIGSAPPTTFYL